MARAIVGMMGLLLLAGCQTRFVGDVSYDPEALYRGYESFAWVEGQGSSTERVRSIAEKAVQAELIKDGLKLAPSRDEADLLVRVNLGRKRRTSMSGGITPAGEQVGMEVILLDRKTGEYAWNGWASKTYSSDLEAEEEVPKALAVIFADFPPKE